MVKKRLFIWAFLLVLASLTFIFAAPQITHSGGTNSTTIREDVTTFFNISVNNTDAGETANITQVNITLPSSFTVTGSTNGTDSAGSFVVSGQVLSWRNVTVYLINGTQRKFFWFNATAATPGNYNITVTTVNGTSGSFSSNISVTVNDTTSPDSVTYGTGTETNGINISRGFLIVNVSATDNVAIDRIVIRLYNSTALMNTSVSSSIAASSGSYWLNFTGLINGTYYFNATVNDTSGNSNTTLPTYIVIVDTVAPTVTLNTPINYTSITGTAMNFTFNITETNSVANCSLIFSSLVAQTTTSVGNNGTYSIYNDSLSAGTYNWTVNCTDTAGNVGSGAYWILTITEDAATTEATSSGGGSSGAGPTYTATPVSLEKGYKVALGKNYKVSLKHNGQSHSVKINEVTGTTVQITVSSDPQTATLNAGGSAKFDLDGDGTYDLNVMLSAIRGKLADFVFTTIDEKVSASAQETPSTPATSENTPANEENAPITPEENKGMSKVLIAMGIFVVLIAVVVVILVGRNAKKKMN